MKSLVHRRCTFWAFKLLFLQAAYQNQQQRHIVVESYLMVTVLFSRKLILKLIESIDIKVVLSIPIVKMSDNVNPHDSTVQQAEIPQHYAYIYKFRVEQCPLFLQHKCTQHRPFTCFHWHFQNQRRRKPLRRRDGSLNYSADEYCTKYDETTGMNLS